MTEPSRTNTTIDMAVYHEILAQYREKLAEIRREYKDASLAISKKTAALANQYAKKLEEKKIEIVRKKISQ